MFRLLVICGCLLAVGQAGVIGGGLLAATAPAAVAVQPAAAATLPLSAATVALPTIATSSSNVIRGIGNLAPTTLLAPGLTTAYAAAPAITTGLAAAPLGLNGLALNGIGALKVL
ncbi:PREDICTED: uncharacterized protein LOC108554450 isoform X2 [Eufriesea mexicana]|uniref:uncharacterized protein LOC108554450 isoform X2 n=1 Tax=Eufriesea mexicana TaxID=516756 RepID=UPI00083C281E|nr:PREDICTED: uncharacterized protein LOC108554450 isoform X2 [Eufriesea mexicana]